MIKITGNVLNGICVHVADHFAPYKVYSHLETGTQVMINTITKKVTMQLIPSETTYEALKDKEAHAWTQLYIQAVKRAPYAAVRDFVFSHEGSRLYINEQLTKVKE